MLGAIETGVDFEKRIADIYQRCRKPEEIKTAFDQLQLELSFEINEAMTQTRRKLLENFDDEVREKLRVQDASSKAVLDRFERLLMRLTRHELKDHAEFLNDSSFRLHASPFAGEIPLGLYELPRRSGDAHTYRLNHPLAEAVIAQAKSRELPPAEIQFDYDAHDGRISILKPLRGQSGYLSLSNLYTIVPLRAANAKILIEQSIGRGLRLPYGRRTGVTAVDRLNIVAHDKFQEIIDEANRPGSVIHLQKVELSAEQLEHRTVTVVSQSQLATKLGLLAGAIYQQYDYCGQ